MVFLGKKSFPAFGFVCLIVDFYPSVFLLWVLAYTFAKVEATYTFFSHGLMGHRESSSVKILV